MSKSIIEYIEFAEEKYGVDSREANLGTHFKNTLLNLIGSGEMCSHMTNKLSREKRSSNKLEKVRNSTYSTYYSFQMLTDNFANHYLKIGEIEESKLYEFEEICRGYNQSFEMIDGKLRDLAVTDIDKTTTEELAGSFSSKVDFYTSEGCDKKMSVKKAFIDSVNENTNAYFCLIMAGVYDSQNNDYKLTINNVKLTEDKAAEHYAAHGLHQVA